MKVRIYYDGYADRYLPQYKLCDFIWVPFKAYQLFHAKDNRQKLKFLHKDDALNWLQFKKNDLLIEKKRKQEAVLRAKSTGVVFEENWELI